MGYKMGNASRLRVNNPLAWRQKVERSIARHRGVLKLVSQDLGVGYSTLKRWIQGEAGFQTAVDNARGHKDGTGFARQIVRARRRVRRQAVA